MKNVVFGVVLALAVAGFTGCMGGDASAKDGAGKCGSSSKCGASKSEGKCGSDKKEASKCGSSK